MSDKSKIRMNGVSTEPTAQSVSRFHLNEGQNWSQGILNLQGDLPTLGSIHWNLNEYPSESYHELKEAIADFYDIHLKNIFLTQGASEALRLISWALIRPETRVALPSDSFPHYKFFSDQLGAKTCFYANKLFLDVMLDLITRISSNSEDHIYER